MGEWYFYSAGFTGRRKEKNYRIFLGNLMTSFEELEKTYDYLLFSLVKFIIDLKKPNWFDHVKSLSHVNNHLGEPSIY